MCIITVNHGSGLRRFFRSRSRFDSNSCHSPSNDDNLFRLGLMAVYKPGFEAYSGNISGGSSLVKYGASSACKAVARLLGS
jgi:hypothetical protein